MPEEVPVKSKAEQPKIPKCGIAMPMSEMTNYSSDHMLMMKDLLHEAIDVAGFEPHMVGSDDETHIIHRNIVQHLYHDDVIVFDVTGKNGNVMFELGMRITFDKPMVIVMDVESKAAFDIGPVEYIPYSSKSGYVEKKQFKRELVDKIKSTNAKRDTEGRSSYLKTFGDFNITKLKQIDVSTANFIIESLTYLTSKFDKLEVQQKVEETSEIQIAKSQFIPISVFENVKEFLNSRLKKIKSDEFGPGPGPLLKTYLLQDEYVKTNPDHSIYYSEIGKIIGRFVNANLDDTKLPVNK